MYLHEVERLIRRDPARRGLISTEEALGPLCPGHLGHAAIDLAKHGRRAVIITGFYIPSAPTPAAETDGPPGAAILASCLMKAGVQIQIVTDEPCRRAVEIAAEEMGISPESVHAISNDPDRVDEWLQTQIHDTASPPLTHMIAIERVGPSHTCDSIRDPEETAEFERCVPSEQQGHCYNMRGQNINEFTAPLHRLFDAANKIPSIKTIGIGDGGNEIGMGSISCAHCETA